jgi:hypothetical protein
MIFEDEQIEPEETIGHRPGIVTTVIITLLIIALLATLVWPLLRGRSLRPTLPTPTPIPLQEA